MDTPQKPPLRIVKDMNPQQNSGIDYKALVTTVVVTTVASVLTTMGVYWLRDKAARKREVEPMPNQSFNPQMLGSGQMALPPGGAYYFPPNGQGMNGMQMGNMGMPQMGLPQSLQFQPQQFQQFQQFQDQPQPQPQQRRAANDQAPSYFVKWAKQQDERFARLEEQLAGEEQDVG